ncbi:hypothetical protein GCM10010329_17120 [Streptomyces spiroverticillatus]|uniref:Uncharacterized protein n=1 Tax=Streptomyces finlayi TaxID=67296 RepID=A0A918WTS0_9ACTN|nr:hypothetical protein [Streptomyces finlayi]GGZ96488.1 hypothetical protein GCM10010329_17120 [Streptomyces spiroverticillatus]GHC81858.1 hypothetical protein GCM10010334_09600 [Streptomyces finlayi]
MWESGAPFAELVQEALQGTTSRQLAQRAVDPVTGFQATHTTLWKIGQGQSVKIHPGLVRAVAAGIGKPEREVQLAAAQQYVGLVAGDPLGASTAETTVVVAHVPGSGPKDMTKLQELLKTWAVDGKEGTPSTGGNTGS